MRLPRYLILFLVFACILVLFLMMPTSNVRQTCSLDGGNNARRVTVNGKGEGEEPPDTRGEDMDDKETLRITEHPDIDVRGRLQKQRILEFCRKHFIYRERSFPKKEEDLKPFYRHLIFDDHTQSIFCFVPKVGCTNMKRLMFYMGGHLPLYTVDWPWVDDTIYLEPALKHASLMNNTLTGVQRTNMMASYYKFMIVRNPLERIVSAFRNKIEPPLDYKKQDKFPQGLKKTILKRYRPVELTTWQGSPNTNISVSFQEFVQFLTEVDSPELNEHFRPSMDICHPCLVQYDFYGNFKNYSHDAAALIKKFRTDPKYYRDESLHSAQDQTFRLLHRYYSQLTHREKVKLLGTWYDELAFYYTLYPSEQSMHRTLLGINLIEKF